MINLDPTEKAEVLHSVLCHPTPPDLSQKHITFHNEINRRSEFIISNISKLAAPHKLFDALNSQIRRYELIKCIHELDKDKAYGPDLIHNQMLINGGPNLWTHLLKLFNKCLKTGCFQKSGICEHMSNSQTRQSSYKS